MNINRSLHDPLALVRLTRVPPGPLTGIPAGRWFLGILLILCLSFPHDVATANEYRPLGWNTLMPANWNLEAELARFGVHDLEDDDPRAPQLMKDIREAWDQIPPVQSLDGVRIRIQGFVFPVTALPEDATELPEDVTEFLLAPYQGQCIHQPPPPANQRLYAVAETPIPGLDTNRPVYVFGELKVARTETARGLAGYRLHIEKVEPYRRRLNMIEWWWGAKSP